MPVLDFEKPLVELGKAVDALRNQVNAGQGSQKELDKQEKKLARLRKKVFQKLTRWQRVQLSRHMDRPHSIDYMEGMLTDFTELHGDRMGHDDPAVVTGLGRLKDIPLVVIGHEKGRTIQERTQRNFGMPHPEGNWKALRMMKLAERFKRPILSLIDTFGAYPGVEAEARGQAGAIANNLLNWASLRTPSLAVIIGEGGSGGALAMAMADRVLMMEHTYYSVISPEGCAAILWRQEEKRDQAAEALRITSEDALKGNLIHEIVPEPPGGAHRNPKEAIRILAEYCERHFNELIRLPERELLETRYERYKNMGVFAESDWGG